MAREHARIKLSIWSDQDWRNLSMHSQWLYQHLLSSPMLTYAGVADWRPARIAKFCATGTADIIERAAFDLEQSLMVVTDRDTEEALVRSYLRNDGVVSQPNVTIAACKAWQNTASAVLRSVIAYEMERLDVEYDHAVANGDEKGIKARRAFAPESDSRPWIDEVLSSELLDPAEALRYLPPNPLDEGSRKGLRVQK